MCRYVTSRPSMSDTRDYWKPMCYAILLSSHILIQNANELATTNCICYARSMLSQGHQCCQLMLSYFYLYFLAVKHYVAHPACLSYIS